MECALSSCVPAERKVLIIDNGAFGERLVEIARLHGLDVVHLRYDLGQLVRVADVAAALAANPDIAAVAMCHHETSAGVMNPVREIGALCRNHDALLLVDAVSSLGAEDLDVVRDGIDVCWSSANKCLHGISGVAFLCIDERVWERIADIEPRSYYLDLKRYRKYFTELAQTPFTPAVATYFALDAACDEYLEDGALKRQAMYAARNRKLREGLARMGISFYTDSGHESHSILTPRVPEFCTFGELYEDLKSSGFVIYDSKPPLKGKYFQIANMGDLSEATLDAFLVAFGDALARGRARRGHPGLAEKVYSRLNR
jgi:2-aminoethylphosphonate-pyruvate transaminase